MDLFVICIVTIITILSTTVIYMKWLLQSWKRRNIPYLEPSVPFGNLDNPIIKKRPLGLYFHEFYKKLKQTGAKYGGIYMYWSPVLLMIDPEYIKQVLCKDFQSFHERGFYHNEKEQPISVNMFTVDGERWRRLRTKFTPTFTSAKMKNMFHIMVDASKSLNEYVADHVAAKTPLDSKDCMGRSVSDIIGTCAFGIECNSFKDTTFRDMIQEIVNGSMSVFKVSFCSAMPKLARFFGIVLFPPKQASYITASIDEAIKVRTGNKINRNDFLQLLMEMDAEDIITRDELKAQCLMFFGAGLDSTKNTLVFLLFELACNLDIQQNLREEITKVLDEHDGEVTYEAIMSMKYLDMVLCETLRKYPPVAFVIRKCSKTTTLPNSDVVIEKGTNITIPIFALHRDPEYFPEPESFIPERFSDQNKSKIIPYTYLPFGEGPRNCVADRFAKQEMKTIIANFIKQFKFRLHGTVGIPLEFNPSGAFISPSADILFDVEEALK